MNRGIAGVGIVACQREGACAELGESTAARYAAAVGVGITAIKSQVGMIGDVG